MKRTVYLHLDEVVELHSQLIQVFGGRAGMRDLGLLESCLARPQSGYYDSLSKQAAALLQSLLLNPCFVDGNKRVAIAAKLIFLRLNGYPCHIKVASAERFLIHSIINNHADIEAIAAWLEKSMSRR